MSRPLRVLIVEDSADDAALLVRELRRGGYDLTCERVDTAGALQAALVKQPWDIVISDYSMPHFDAPAALRLLQESGLDVPFIIVSGAIGEDTAVAAMKAGAHDYLMKGSLARLNPAIERELREAEGRRERKRVEETLRQREEQLRQAQKLEVVGRLAGGIAHDFNNLLMAIMGHSDLLLLHLSADAPLRGRVEGIRETAQRAAALIRQLLAFSRQQVLQPTVLDLNAVVANMEPMLRPLIGEHIELVTSLDPALGHVKADPGQIEQVVMNLAVNACDAMPHGGRLTVTTAHSERDDAYARAHIGVTPGRYVLLAVSDTGCGMDAETQVHLFEPFFTTKKPGKGTGLGLAIVYGIVTQSGGHIEVASTLGRGTTVTIALPRVDDPIVVVGADTAHMAPLHGWETLLLVEDEVVARHTVREMLQMSGYTVLEAGGGSEALCICEQHTGPLHLLVTDVIMPDMSGCELAQRLAPLRPAMKVLYMSGYTGDLIAYHGTWDPGMAFLQKPFTLDTLARKVREVLDTPPTQQ